MKTYQNYFATSITKNVYTVTLKVLLVSNTDWSFQESGPVVLPVKRYCLFHCITALKYFSCAELTLYDI